MNNTLFSKAVHDLLPVSFEPASGVVYLYPPHLSFRGSGNEIRRSQSFLTMGMNPVKASTHYLPDLTVGRYKKRFPSYSSDVLINDKLTSLGSSNFSIQGNALGPISKKSRFKLQIVMSGSTTTHVMCLKSPVIVEVNPWEDSSLDQALSRDLAVNTLNYMNESIPVMYTNGGAYFVPPYTPFLMRTGHIYYPDGYDPVLNSVDLTIGSFGTILADQYAALIGSKREGFVLSGSHTRVGYRDMIEVNNSTCALYYNVERQWNVFSTAGDLLKLN